MVWLTPATVLAARHAGDVRPLSRVDLEDELIRGSVPGFVAMPILSATSTMSPVARMT
jgi:hypothetical protein